MQEAASLQGPTTMNNSNVRYRSRVLRELVQNKDNAFISPPSSTGSSRSISPTMNSITSIDHLEEIPQQKTGNSDRLPPLPRQRKSTRFGAHSPNVHTSILERTFPGWYKETREEASDSMLNSVSAVGSTKEHSLPPLPRSLPESTFYAGGEPRTLSQMQPRVDNVSVSDTSTVLPSSGKAPMSLVDIGRSGSALDNKPLVTQLSTLPSSPPLRRVAPYVRADLTMGDTTMNRTTGSFFLPNLTHIHDFIAGKLKLGTTKSGVPIFVKNGKVNEISEVAQALHKPVDNIKIPEDEHKIFVSIDMMRDEITTLQEHHDILQREAEQLQNNVRQLNLELERVRGDRKSDSGLGSCFETPVDTQLQEQIATLQSRLDQATRQISLAEIHQLSLASERDQALQELASEREQAAQELYDAHQQFKAIELELIAAQRELESTARLRSDLELLTKENNSLSTENALLQKHHGTLSDEILWLRKINRSVTQQHDKLQRKVELLLDELKQLRAESAHTCADCQSRDMADTKTGKLASTQPTRLEERVASLELQFIQATRQFNLSEAKQSLLCAERDQAVKELAVAQDRLKKMELQLADAQKNIVSNEQANVAAESVPNSMPEAKSLLVNNFDDCPEVRDSAETRAPQVQSRDKTRMPMFSFLSASDPSKVFEEFMSRNLNMSHRQEQKNLCEGTQSPSPRTAQPSNSLDDLRIGQSTKAADKRASCEQPQEACHKPTISSPTAIESPPTTCGTKKRVQIARPVPASKRLVQQHQHHQQQQKRQHQHQQQQTQANCLDHRQEAAEDAQDETLRPSRAPGEALAIVIQTLGDEAAHLQLTIAEQRAQYDALDPAVGRRARKSILRELTSSMRLLDAKRDQIYALYDVLEGQKQAGQVMTADELLVDWTAVA